jgi:hypothetical protein
LYLLCTVELHLTKEFCSNVNTKDNYLMFEITAFN